MSKRTLIRREQQRSLFPEPPVDSVPPADRRFENWIRRPDLNGRMGWETLDLPRRIAWWRWSTWEDLPDGSTIDEPGEAAPTSTPAVVERCGVSAHDTTPFGTK